MTATKPKTSSKNSSQPRRGSFIRKHLVWIIVTILLLIPAILLAIGWALAIKEKEDFRAIKQDMLTLQERLNTADGGGWEYNEGCDRSGGGFQATITYCELGITRKYENVDQKEINRIVEKTNDQLRNLSGDLFVPKDASLNLAPPKLVGIESYTIFNDKAEKIGIAQTGTSIKSIKSNPISCGFGYDLSAQIDKSTDTGSLDVEIRCHDLTSRTYFPRTDINPQFSDHKAEDPL